MAQVCRITANCLGCLPFFMQPCIYCLIFVLTMHWYGPVIVTDVVESSYIWFGLFAYVIIFLLAITSPKSAKKWMGKAWKKLHRFIYPASIAVIIHYFWQLKGNLLQPVFYTLLVFVLLAFRVAVWYKNRQFSRLMIPKSREIDD